MKWAIVQLSFVMIRVSSLVVLSFAVVNLNKLR